MGSCLSCCEAEPTIPIQPIKITESTTLKDYTRPLTARQRRRAKQRERYQRRSPP